MTGSQPLALLGVSQRPHPLGQRKGHRLRPARHAVHGHAVGEADVCQQNPGFAINSAINNGSNALSDVPKEQRNRQPARRGDGERELMSCGYSSVD